MFLQAQAHRCVTEASHFWQTTAVVSMASLSWRGRCDPHQGSIKATIISQVIRSLYSWRGTCHSRQQTGCSQRGTLSVLGTAIISEDIPRLTGILCRQKKGEEEQQKVERIAEKRPPRLTSGRVKKHQEEPAGEQTPGPPISVEHLNRHILAATPSSSHRNMLSVSRIVSQPLLLYVTGTPSSSSCVGLSTFSPWHSETLSAIRASWAPLIGLLCEEWILRFLQRHAAMTYRDKPAAESLTTGLGCPTGFVRCWFSLCKTGCLSW